jgi:hypothetical protein
LEEEFESWLRSKFEDFPIDQNFNVLLDISCMTRLRLSACLKAFVDRGCGSLHVFYSLASYSAPNLDDSPNEYLGPVSPEFAGWSGEFGKPVAVVCGLGYEHMKALGVIDHIDPIETWVFFPESPLGDYDIAVSKANRLLLSDVGESNVVKYPVLDAPGLVRDLFSLIANLRQDNRCVLLPLGPKIFAFCALLTGILYKDLAIWRVSAGRYARPVDRTASDHQALFRVSFNG